MSEAPITDIESWLAALLRPSALAEMGALAVCAALAWGLGLLVARPFGRGERPSILFGQKVIDGVLFPALLLVLALVARGVLSHWMPVAIFRIAVPAVMALLAIRLGVKVLQAAFRDAVGGRLLPRLRALWATLTPPELRVLNAPPL